jgi:ABC-2 type transport system permease protein
VRGLLISTAVKTQTQAMHLSTFYMLPSILLTGFMFPREAMPLVMRALGNLLPMTYYLTSVGLVRDLGSRPSPSWPSPACW